MIQTAVMHKIKLAHRGFTLLELLVVCVLIALMLSVAVPNLRSLYRNDPLAQSAHAVEQIVARAQSTAIELDGHVRLSIDTSANMLAIHPERGLEEKHGQSDADETGFTVRLPQRVVISSVWTSSVKRDKGEPISAWINERGMVEPLVVNISDGGRVMGIRFSPFVPLEISDREVVPADPSFAQIN